MTRRWTNEEFDVIKQHFTKNNNKVPIAADYDILEHKLDRTRKSIQVKTQEIRDILKYNSYLTEFDRITAIGFDEVGVGPLAGPIIVAGVLLNPDRHIDGLKDSKTFTGKHKVKKIHKYADLIYENSLWCDIDVKTVEEIGDRSDFKQYALESIFNLVEKIPEEFQDRPIIIDGEGCIKYKRPNVFPGMDKFDPQIAAASIIAKSMITEMMYELDKTLPQYGFKNHRGYGTDYHKDAIRKFGITPYHMKYYQNKYKFNGEL